jgi:CDP-diacylglycerol---glycerol-3-phosphate 3-phosphatidyltransferase
MANLITVVRVLLLFGAIALIYTENYWIIVATGFLIAAIFAGDGLDGYVARRRNSSSRLGAVLDIAGDRVVENALWVTFAVLGVVGLWIPLVVLTRSFAVDVMRSVALSEGKTPFGESTMMRSKFTWFLTASRFSRVFYGWSKALGFVFLTWLVAWRLEGADGRVLDILFEYQIFRAFGWFLVYSSVALCVIRGLPVLYDALYYLREEQDQEAANERGDAARIVTERGERSEPA